MTEKTQEEARAEMDKWLMDEKSCVGLAAGIVGQFFADLLSKREREAIGDRLARIELDRVPYGNKSDTRTKLMGALHNHRMAKKFLMKDLWDLDHRAHFWMQLLTQLNERVTIEKVERRIR